MANDFKLALVMQMPDVVFAAGEEIVDGDDFVALRNEPIGEV